MAKPLEARQQQTQNARLALAAKFPDSQSRSAFYRGLAEKSNAARIVLSAADVEVIADAQPSLERLTRIVAKIAERVEREGGG